MTHTEIQRLILRTISSKWGDVTLYTIGDALRRKGAERLRGEKIMESVWTLIAQNYLYIDYAQPSPTYWKLSLTAKGRAAVSDEDINPDNPAGYIRYLCEEIPDLQETVKVYVHEALYAYNNDLCRASSVMLGVASEAVVLEVAVTLGRALQGREAQQYLQVIEARRPSYIAKFEAFRKKLESKKIWFPDELTDSLDLTMNSVGELLRIYRNRAGHPTGDAVDRRDCFTHLHMFVLYAKRLYAIKSCLEARLANSMP